MSLWLAKAFLVVANVAGYTLLLLPLAIVLILSFSAGRDVTFPPPGLSFRWFEYIAQRGELIDSLRNSVILACIAAVLSLGLGILGSLAMVRHRFRGRQVVEGLFLAPLFVPSLVIGVSLVQFFSLIGLLDSFTRLVLGHLVLTVPYTIRSISACLYGVDRSLEEASLVMGASPFKTFRRVLLPLLRPGIVVALLFAFIVSFGNITVSIFLIGGNTVMLPVRILTYLQYQFNPSVAAISTILILITLAALAITERTLGLTRIRTMQV